MSKGKDILEKLLQDPEITEIMINGPENIFIEKGGQKYLSEHKFSSNQELLEVAQEVFAKREKKIDKDNPYGDVCLEDGSRVNVVISPIALQGIAVTIRKFSKSITSLDDLIKLEALTEKAAKFLIAGIKGRLNMLFSGGTGTGKTTTLEMLSYHIPEQERIITIEDTAELKMHHDNLVSMETKDPDYQGRGGADLSALIKNSLRMRPDRIIIGEVRGPEALDMIQAMSTGHRGTLAVMHGNSPKEALARLETLILSSGIALSVLDVRKMISDTIDIVIQQNKFPDGTRKIVNISEVRGIERGEIALQDLFVFHKRGRDAQGKILGSLSPRMRMFPKFFNEFQKAGLIDEKTFSDDE